MLIFQTILHSIQYCISRTSIYEQVSWMYLRYSVMLVWMSLHTRQCHAIRQRLLDVYICHVVLQRISAKQLCVDCRNGLNWIQTSASGTYVVAVTVVIVIFAVAVILICCCCNF